MLSGQIRVGCPRGCPRSGRLALRSSAANNAVAVVGLKPPHEDRCHTIVRHTPQTAPVMMTRSFQQQVLVALGLLLAASGGLAYREHAPRPAPGLQAAAGVEATMFAEAPMITNPIAIDVDARGRVWLTEGHNYRLSMHPDYPVRQEGDRIRILEDTDGDGVADTAKTFYQGRDIDAALGLVVLGNRVIVSAYENVYVFSDTNGDDRADEKRVLFKRGPANSDHSTHSFIFGPDGRLYFNAGNDAGPLKDPSGTVLTDRAGKRIVPD